MTSAAPYITVAGSGSSEIVVERSRFLGAAHPVADLDAALALVKASKAEHYNARHVCYGLRVGRGAQRIDRSNDDGEPARTGGYPLWQLLDGEQATNALLIVVRYFGGTKLGTGGLARAYREDGRQALSDAGLKTVHPEITLALPMAYGMIDRFNHFLKDQEVARVVDTTYAAEVTFHLAVRAASEHDFRAALAALLQRSPESF